LTTILPLSAAIIAGAFAYLAMTNGGRDVRNVNSLAPLLKRVLAAAGFGIDQVSVTGQTYTSDKDIFDAIDLANVTSFADLDPTAVRTRIERLPWVETAELTRTFPGELQIRITERTPFALWRRRDRDFLIDRTGRVLAPIRRDATLAFPIVEGEGAPMEASSLTTLLARFPEIAKRVERAEWVAGRRWSLHLEGGTTINLPADREALALEEIMSERHVRALIESPGQVIDLRAPGRITVRPSPVKNSGDQG
jgi:cell division protein FtsQ